MAENTTTDWLKISGSTQEARRREKDQAAQREKAENRPHNRILKPTDIQTGAWDSAKVLQTTLGGVKRDINADDLVAFKKNINTVQKKHLISGITPQQVIDFSRSEDRKRTAKSYQLGSKDIQPIKHAIPLSATKGVVKFMTNAGGSTPGVVRHYVQVQFINYTAYASGATPAIEAAKLMRKEPIKFDCDCGRHQFWYRYIATIGNFAHGRSEHGYPKIRNPKLSGVACKHTLRAMHEILNNHSVLVYLEKHIEKGQTDLLKIARKRQSQKKAERLLQEQLSRKSEGNALKTSRQLANEALKNAAKIVSKPDREAPATRRTNNKLEAEIAETEAAMRALGRSERVIKATIDEMKMEAMEALNA